MLADYVFAPYTGLQADNREHKRSQCSCSDIYGFMADKLFNHHDILITWWGYFSYEIPRLQGPGISVYTAIYGRGLVLL